MDLTHMDQADGLRRLFSAAPPEVLAVVPCAAVTTGWLAGQLQVRARAGVSMLVLDEWQACGNLADCLHVSPRFDLLQAVQGHVEASMVVQEVQPGLSLCPVGQLSRELVSDRIIRQRTLSCLQGLQAGCDEWLLHACAGGMEAPSPLVLAAPRTLLLIDSHPMSVTTAWATLRRFSALAPSMQFLLGHVGEQDAHSLATQGVFCQMAASRLRLQIERIGSLGEAMLLGERQSNLFADAFITRLLQNMPAPAVKPLDARFPGNSPCLRQGVP